MQLGVAKEIAVIGGGTAVCVTCFCDSAVQQIATDTKQHLSL